MQRRLGAQGGPFARAYVIAHEDGHYLQNTLGILEGGTSQTRGSQGGAVRVELMADCLADVWTHNAARTGFLQPSSDRDIAQALDAAAAVGDDRIQSRMQGRVSPESWTHGSSEQRQPWFATGYRSGSVDDCNTLRGRV